MEKYNDFLRNITKLIEKGLFASKDIKKDVEETFKSKLENIVNQLNLVSRDEFEVQKKMIKKIEKKFNQYKKK
jgi:BMFP domain-containing protein YqiC